MFLGVDQSYTSCGYVVIDKGVIVDFGKVTTDKATDIFDRAVTVATYVVHLVSTHKPSHIAIEGLAFGMRGDATRDLAGLQFTIINAIRTYAKDNNLNYPVQIISPKTLKKFATGSGKANKVEMIEKLPNKVRELFLEAGFKKTTGLADLADSYWLAMYQEDCTTKK